MTARVQVRGTLTHTPESRKLKGGGLCVAATLKAKNGDRSQYWQIVAFSEEPRSELMRLSEGDAVAVQGSLKADLFDRGGEVGLLFGVIAEHAVALRQPGQKRRKTGKPAIYDEASGSLAPTVVH